MENSSLIRVLTRSDLKNAKVLIPNKAVYLEKFTRLRIDNTKKFDSSKYKYIFLLDNNKRVGIILNCGDSDIHCYTLKKYRNKGYMSNLMKSGVIKKVWPEIKSITSIHYPGSAEYEIVKHLASLAGLYLEN